MNDFIQNLNQRLNLQLRAIDETGQGKINKSCESAQRTLQALLELKAFVIHHRQRQRLLGISRI